jgi:hypothetical protein
MALRSRKSLAHGTNTSLKIVCTACSRSRALVPGPGAAIRASPTSTARDHGVSGSSAAGAEEAAAAADAADDGLAAALGRAGFLDEDEEDDAAAVGRSTFSSS